MTTAIIGVGKIGTTVARYLVNGGERVILASHGAGQAEAIAKELGKNARAGTVEQAINDADVVVFAVWFDTIKELISQHARLLEGKVVVDPSNPITAGDGGKFVRTLPDGVSAGAEIAKRLPKGAHYVKALGTLGAEALASSSNRTPSRAALYYATDDRPPARRSARTRSAELAKRRKQWPPPSARSARPTGRPIASCAPACCSRWRMSSKRARPS